MSLYKFLKISSFVALTIISHQVSAAKVIVTNKDAEKNLTITVQSESNQIQADEGTMVVKPNSTNELTYTTKDADNKASCTLTAQHDGSIVYTDTNLNTDNNVVHKYECERTIADFKTSCKRLAAPTAK